jgi:hypothetical protein
MEELKKRLKNFETSPLANKKLVSYVLCVLVEVLQLNQPSYYQGGQGLTQVWLTPKWILDPLGPFDLDPCANGLKKLSQHAGGGFALISVRPESKYWMDCVWG